MSSFEHIPSVSAAAPCMIAPHGALHNHTPRKSQSRALTICRWASALTRLREPISRSPWIAQRLISCLPVFFCDAPITITASMTRPTTNLISCHSACTLGSLTVISNVPLTSFCCPSNLVPSIAKPLAFSSSVTAFCILLFAHLRTVALDLMLFEEIRSQNPFLG